jgi:tripartite-type tricarboxylate transporter receptor subunit TctC
VQSGLVRAIGLLTRDKPAFVGDIKPVAEQGVPAIDASLFVGLFAPANIPPGIAERLGFAVSTILKEQGLRQKFHAIGADPAPLTGPAFKAYIVSTAERYAKIVREAGIKPER